MACLFLIILKIQNPAAPAATCFQSVSSNRMPIDRENPAIPPLIGEVMIGLRLRNARQQQRSCSYGNRKYDRNPYACAP